ncbi:MAG: hypothetical protein E7600_00325 [Ruminococcaceae bacterium]|nr:hypothetical protein [Oscillospiraceae bacterium]
MKKALSILLCLAMLVSTVPMSVFAAPSAVTAGDSADEFVLELPEETQENDSVEAELAAEGTVLPIKVLPKDGEMVDRRYPVAYYTFGKSVKIDAADVTVENIGNDAVGGVYFDEETNTIWVFPAKPMSTVYATNKVSYEAWTSNIAAEDGSLLSFPGVNFDLDTEIPNDGKNIVPFGDMEYGWSPFDLAETSGEGQFSVVEDPTNPDNHVVLRTWKSGASKWPHARADVAWTPGSTYKIVAKVMVKNFINDAGTVAPSGSSTITPDLIYYVPSFTCTGDRAHEGQTGTVCTQCQAPVDREHETSFVDHMIQDKAANVSVTSGISNGWQTIEVTDVVARTNLDVEEPRALSLYSNPYGSYATEFYIDDVEVYERINVTYAAGRYTESVGRGVAVKRCYVGDTFELPLTIDARGRNGFKSTNEKYVIDGWTDGTNVYAEGEEYTVTGPITLTPNVVPAGDGYKVNFSVSEEFEDYYAGPGFVSVALGENVDLTAEEFELGVPVGYSVLGWKNVATGEFVTSVSGANNEVINLEAVFELRTGIVIDTEAKAAELKSGAITAFDDTVPGLKVTPTGKDPFVVFDNLAIDAEEYSFVDVTYVANDTLTAANGGFVYIDSDTSKSAAGAKHSEDAGLVTYRYDLAANEAWIDTCSSIRIDPYNDTAEFTVTEIQFVKNEVVAEIEISDLTAPVISAVPDMEAEVPADAPYEIVSVVWEPEAEYFKGATEYTAAVELAINKSGYMFTEDTTALLNGENADAVVSAKTATVTYTFPATEAPKAITITLTSADAITVNDGTLALEAAIAPVNSGDVILPDTYTWAITGGDNDIATLEGNVLTAKWNGTVEVTATPDYDVSQAQAFNITITGQTGFTVTYDKNTGADVENMPENDRAKKDYTISSKVPTREGFSFGGWMLSPDADVTVTDLKVTKDTTLYAKWLKGGYVAHFDNEGDAISSSDAYVVALADGNKFGANGAKHTESVTLDVENSEFAIKLNGGNDFYMTLTAGSAKAINLDNVSAVEYGFRTDAKGNFGCTLYYATKDENGEWIAPDHATGGQTYIDNSIPNQSIAVDGNVNTLYKFRIDTSARDVFSGYLHHVRLDIENSASFPGKTVYIDYVKLIGAESVENIELDITAPKASDEVYGLDSVNTASGKYEVKSITWEGPELVDGKYYAGSAAYTAKVEIEAAAGYALSDKPMSVTVNGEDAEIAVNGNKATVTYTFPATEDLIDIQLGVKVKDNAPAEITTSLGTLQLEHAVRFDASSGVVPNGEVYWSIDPSQKKYGWVDANGLVTGNTDCEELIVTATSKYDPSVKASIAIKVTGQIPEKNIYFEAGTGETVNNLPAPTLAKDEYELPNDVIPTRTNYVFKGWSKEIGGEIIKVDDVKQDTTYYAVWGSYVGEEMTGTNFAFNTSGGTKTFTDGIMTMVPTNTLIKEGFAFEKENITFREGRRNVKVVTSEVDYLEIKTTIAPDELEICVYTQNADANGNKLSSWEESANTRFYSNKRDAANNPNQDISKYVEKQGDWYIYKLPAKLFKNWSEYLYRLRLNFIRRDVDATTSNESSYLPFADGTEVRFDYIRFVGRDIPAMDITGIAAPTVKGEAATTATVKQNDAFKITSMEWSPALLGGIFFGSGEEYTVTVNVEILKGYKAFSNPPARVTINGKEAVYSRFNDTKATITYTFPATEDIGELDLVNVNLHETNDFGTVTETKQIFSGDDFNLDKFSATNNPTGKRWIGWSETDGGELISGTINITEDADYYAYYEDITGYDFSNKYHKNEKNVKASNGTASFDGAWVVVTPDTDTSSAVLTLDGMNISSADYDLIEIIYDGSLEDANNDNKFNENFAPVLKVNGTMPVALVKAEPVIASNRVSYKYTYDLTVNGKPDVIGSFDLAPYTGNPAWAVTSVMLVPNAELEEAVEIKGIKAPETWLMPDVSAEASEGYEIESIAWNSAEGFNDDGSYKSETEYTVTIIVSATTGNKIIVEDAIIDGVAVDSATLGANGKLTITKTYPETEALIPFELTVADAEITVADGTVQLVPTFTPAIEVNTVKWEIVENGPEGKSATIDENGVVKAFFDGTVKVKATSDYNPLISAEATVTITNQIAFYNVTFNPNTTGVVTNMPANAKVKLDYVLPTEVPVREGFSFAGWVKSPTDTASITKDYVTKDTTYYALWVRGLHFEFFDPREKMDTHKQRSEEVYDYENGTYSYVLSGTDPQMYIKATDGYLPGKPESPYGLFDGNDYRILDIRMKTSEPKNFNYGMYFESVDRNGKVLGPPYSQDPGRYVANFVRPKYATGPDEYTNIILDMGSKSDWTDGYPTILRIDFPDDGTNASVGIRYTIDYIRLVNYETSVIEVTGIDVPVAKATADTTAVSKDTSKYVVTDVSWEGGLIYDYYFGGETEYTVCVTVKGAPGYFVSDAPVKATVNGNNVTSTSYNAATGELTLKYTFAATGAVDNDTAHVLTLYGKDDNGYSVAEERTIFEGNTFDLGTYAPANIPSGKRWIGWSEEASATENTAPSVITVTEPMTFYAVFEDLVEFDYSNYYHQFGTTVKAGTSELKFEDGLAVVCPNDVELDTALITPVMNVAGKDFSLVEVYYSSTLDSVNKGTRYDNLFSSVLNPKLKFSTTDAPTDYSYSGVLLKAEKESHNGKSFMKYTYDMSGVSEWAGNNIASFYLDPYNGFPNWGVGLIRLVENEELTDAAEIKLAAPEAWEVPDIADNADINDKYEITDLVWNPVSDTFAAGVSYTVKVTYKPVAGYKVTSPAATINGETATVTDNGNGTFTATYVFEATDELKDVKVVISGNKEIKSKGRYLELKGETVALDGSDIPVTDVTWSIKSKGTDVELATISENGRIYPLSNGTVIVTATSVYNPKVYATYEVKISNQADLVKVTFDKNTHAEVQGMPEAVYVYGNFEPELYNITRDGFFFLGWSVDEDALEPDKSFNITKDTTLYAKWGAGYELSFNDASSALKANLRDVTFKDGIATYSAASNGSGQVIGDKGGMAKSLALPTAQHQTLELRFKPYTATMVKFYLQSADETGTVKSEWAESAAKGSTSTSTIPATSSFQTVSFDLSAHANWNSQPYVEQIRLDLPQSAPTHPVEIDYIRLLTSERSVKFDGNGGLIPLYGGEVTSYKETYPTGVINLPQDPTREGYEFLGWAKKTEDYTKLYNGKFTVTDEVILYAIWTPAAVLSGETVEAEGAVVTENENGTVTVTSTDVTTPTVAIADVMEVGENQTIVVKLVANYASIEDGDTVLSFVDENGDPHEVVLKSGGLSGKETITADLSGEGFEGTVTDVVLTLPTGVVNELTVETVAFASAENAKVFDEDEKKTVSINTSATVVQGGKPTQHPGHISYPALGGGTVTEHKPGAPSKTPADKKLDNLTRPKDDSVVPGTTPGTTTPSTPSKFPFSKTYDGRFVDVTSANWFYGDVEKSYKLGLMNGKSDTEFVPDGTVTLAEAITVAARIRAIYYGDTITQGTGSEWYKPYVEYASKKAIIVSGQYSDYTALATREQVANMFVRALPASWYTEINLFINIPDVPTTHASYAAIQRLYNAGVVIGADNAYNFKPTENIRRSELSAIINRVALTDSRLRVVTEDEKNNKDKKFGVSDIMSTLIVGNCVEKQWTEKDGMPYAVPAKADPVVNGLQDLMGGTLNADEYKKVTVVVTSSGAVAGKQSQLFFSADGTLSEANSLRASVPNKNSDGTYTIVFDGNKNAGWKGDLTVVRFDPWNDMADFSIVSITFAP